MNCTLDFALIVPLKLCLPPLVPNHLKRIMCESTLGEASISLSPLPPSPPCPKIDDEGGEETTQQRRLRRLRRRQL